ncbi:MAG TPA: cell division protein FtsL [Nitrospiria bacterium]
MKKSSLGKFFVVGVLMVMSLILYVWYQAQVIDLGYQIQHLQKEYKKVRKIHQALLIETEHLSSLDRIERIAISTLGMGYPSDKDVILVKRVPHSDSKEPRDPEVIPKIWVAEGKTPNRAGMFW